MHGQPHIRFTKGFIYKISEILQSLQCCLNFWQNNDHYMPRINLWDFFLIFRLINLLSVYTLWYCGLWFRVYHLEDGSTSFLREDSALLDSSWNVMAHGAAREGKWRGNWWMEWVASTLHTTSEHGVSSITTADAHTSTASIRLNWRPPPI
jgi:hypothetical protein